MVLAGDLPSLGRMTRALSAGEPDRLNAPYQGGFGLVPAAIPFTPAAVTIDGVSSDDISEGIAFSGVG